jgi:large subunit ribosomal protein L29
LIEDVTMKSKEIRKKEDDHILHELREQQKHLFTLRTQAVTEKLEDPSQIGKARKDIARLKTILHERLLQAAKSAKAAGPAETVAAAGTAAAGTVSQAEAK